MYNKSSIASWLTTATHRLQAAGITSARLDAELILAHTLRKGRTWIHAHSDELLDVRLREIAEARLSLRQDRVPLAYIIGHKEFYGRRFIVNTATLIPRPESEAMIELLGTLPLRPHMRVVDVGTGSGCLGITAKLEYPDLDVTLTDVDRHALNVAEKNAKQLNTTVSTLRSNLLLHYPFTADIILANLPYVDPDWERSPETEHEPSRALFAAHNGLDLIYKLIEQCSTKLSPDGYLLIESDRRQQHIIDTFAAKHHFTHRTTRGLISVYQKISTQQASR